MLEGNENKGVQQNTELNGNGAEVAKTPKTKKRVLTSDLSARLVELEGRLDAISAGLSKPNPPSPLEQKVLALGEQLAKLDERVTKIAHVVAQSNLMRSPLS
jgi:hypothetical protein